MPPSKDHRFRQHTTALLARAWKHERKGNELLLLPPGGFHLEGDQWPNPLRGDVHSFGLLLTLCQGPGQFGRHEPPLLQCSSQALPFQQDVFRTVILLHLVSDGSEPEVAEACRVLAPGGDLLVVGVNGLSWLGLSRWRGANWPPLKALCLQRQLASHGMEVCRTLGSGVLGLPRWQTRDRGISRWAWPLANLLLVHARHRQGPEMAALKMKNLPAGALPTVLHAR